VHSDGSVEEVGRLGTLLGSDADPLLADVVVELEGDDVLVLYTDGVTEVRRHRREVFGTEQLVELLQGCGGLRPEAVAERVEQAVMRASMGKLRDDMAVLVLGPDPSAAAAGVMLPGPAEGQEPIKESDG
jgi:serine phosphatase RsbU (regulator of sigma subunit)